MNQWQTLRADDGHRFNAYLSKPEGRPGKGVVVVIQEIFGVNSHIRDVCDRIANEGYIAVAPALFDRYSKGYEAGYSPEEVAASRDFLRVFDFDAACRDVSTVVGEFSGLGPVSVVGFCMGGAVAYLMAARDSRVSASVGYYGGRIPDFADETPKCPTLMHFGEQDQGIPIERVDVIRQKQPDVPIYTYPAGHGFNCDQRGSYDEDSARLAWSRTLAFISDAS